MNNNKKSLPSWRLHSPWRRKRLINKQLNSMLGGDQGKGKSELANLNKISGVNFSAALFEPKLEVAKPVNHFGSETC